MKSLRVPSPIVGELYAAPSLIRSLAQDFFLSFLAMEATSALYALQDEVSPVYCRAFDAEERRGVSDDEVQNIARIALVDVVWSARVPPTKWPEGFRKTAKAHAHLYAAAKALLAWQKNFNLLGKRSPPGNLDASFQDEHWALVTALDTILFWRFNPVGSLWEKSDPPKLAPPVFRYADRRIECQSLGTIQLHTFVRNNQTQLTREINTPDWRVQLESELAFRERIRVDFERWLDLHVEQCKKTAQSAGLVLARGTRKVDHFRWAVAFQVAGQSTRSIARKSNVTEAAVEDAIPSILESVNLVRRPGRRGPRRKRTDPAVAP